MWLHVQNMKDNPPEAGVITRRELLSSNYDTGEESGCWTKQKISGHL